MRKRVQNSYGLDSEGEDESKPRCPGESSCSMFGVAKLSGNGLDACKVCELLPTKPKAVTDTEIDEPIESFVDSVYWIRQERLSGFGVNEHAISYLQYKSLLILDSLIERNARISEVKSRMLNERNSEYLQGLIGGTAQI